MFMKLGSDVELIAMIIYSPQRQCEGGVWVCALAFGIYVYILRLKFK